MAEVSSYKQLIVWQKAMDLVVTVYQLSGRLPSSEQYGMTSQLRRAAVSVPANIAEGSARGSVKDYSYFLGIAQGSLMEVETYLLLTTRLKYLNDAEIGKAQGLVTEVSKMLTAIRTKLRDDASTTRT